MYFLEKTTVKIWIMHLHYIQFVNTPVSHNLYTSYTGGKTRVLFAGLELFKVRLRWLGAVLQYPCKFVIVLLSFNILIIIKHH